MNNLPIILAIIPFLVFIFLIFARKSTLFKSSLVTLILYIILGIFYWKILPDALYFSFGKGLLIAIDIFIIIFGAIFFLEILKSRNIIKNISSKYGDFYPLQTFSENRNITFNDIPVFIEASDKITLNLLSEISNKLSTNVNYLNSEKRKILHLAAVFACIEDLSI